MTKVELDFSKGAYFVPLSQDYVPPGHYQQAVNIILTKEGILASRPKFFDTQYQNGTSVGSIGSYGSGMTNFNMLQLGEGSLAAAIWFNAQSATGGLVAINKVGGATNNSVQFAFNYGAPSFCEYNNVIYASTLASGVRKVTVLNFTTSAITEAVVASSPNLVGILSFKNRLFGWNTQNRVFYTDVPSPGGLPETWNTGTNFFDIPGVRGTPTIHNILTVENRLFIFTDSGLYSVLISGPPATWVLRTVDDSISVDNRYSCFVFKNVIYFVDDTSVWVTDGSNFKNIGETLTGLFRYLQFQTSSSTLRKRVFRMGNFLILSVRGQSSGTPLNTYHFMCDMDVFAWSSLFTEFQNNDAALMEIHGTFNSLKTRERVNSQCYLMLSHIENPGTLEEANLYLAESPANVDHIDGVSTDIYYLLTTRRYDFDNPLHYKTCEGLILEIYPAGPGATENIGVSFLCDETAVFVTTGALSLSSTNHLIRIPGPERPFRELLVQISFDSAVKLKNVWADINILADQELTSYPT